MALSTTAYQMIADWPADERVGLMSKTIRVVVSISARLAEGNGRYSRQGFAR